MMQTTETPTWTTGDRLRKAREWAGIGSQQMAAELGVSRNTVSNYEHDKTTPQYAVVRVWSEVTGVPVAWLLETQGESISRSRCFLIDGHPIHYPHLPLEFAVAA